MIIKQIQKLVGRNPKPFLMSFREMSEDEVGKIETGWKRSMVNSI